MVMRSYLFVFLAALTAIAAPAGAQTDRDVSPLSEVVALSEVIGAVHARRLACSGIEDQTWRQQMQRFLALEAPNEGLRRQRMVEAFNVGFSTEQSLRPQCDTASAAEAEARLAAEGRRLAQRLINRYVQ